MPARAVRAAIFCATTALAAATLTGLGPQAAAAPPGEKDVTAVLFEWRFDSVAKACTDSLGPAGYGYVQVSPPQEHVQGGQWWTSYQPVSYKIAGRLGDRAAFKAMVDTCHAAGVKVVADSVINHMAGPADAGCHLHGHRRYFVHEVQLPGPLLRFRPGRLPGLDLQLPGPGQRPELRARAARRPGHR